MKSSKLIPYLLVLLLVVSILGVLSYDGVDAAPAPTRTPVAVEGTPEPQHWELLEDEAVGYLLTHPDCFLGLQDLGGGAYRLKLDCNPQ